MMMIEPTRAPSIYTSISLLLFSALLSLIIHGEKGFSQCIVCFIYVFKRAGVLYVRIATSLFFTD